LGGAGSQTHWPKKGSSMNRLTTFPLVRRVAACLFALALVAHVGGCKKADATSASTAGGGGSSVSKPITVGFIYVGTRDDYGYNQAHAEGAAEVKKMAGVKVIENEKVLETKDCQQAMESMINLNGATLLFPTSFGYFNPHV